MSRRERLTGELESVLQDENSGLSEKERQILEKAREDLRDNVDVNRCLFDLKARLSEMSVKGELSSKLLQYFTELSRREPSTSVSSMWNFLVKT